MTDVPERRDPLDDLAERQNSASARKHVGAAGFAQRNTLEQIISAGREQIESTQSLRQVISITLTQLNDLSLGKLGNDTATQIEALKRIVTAGQAQVRTAADLRTNIQRTLTEIRGTPLEQVSVQLLTVVSESVRQQVTDLEHIIAAAIGEANTIEQIAELRQVNSEAVARALKVEHRREEQSLAQLDLLGQEALERIRTLEADGETHAEQRIQMEQEAQTSEQILRTLEAEDVRDRADLQRLEARNEALNLRVDRLEKTGMDVREKLDEVRQELESEG